MAEPQAAPVHIVESQTSYFSEPATLLDPRLFRGTKLIPAVRDAVLATLYGHLGQHFADPDSWTTVWLAGSGVSYQWTAQRDPADLDCLIAVNFVQFRHSNSGYMGLSDAEIAALLNEGFKSDLHPATDNFMDSYELTFYVNPAKDIRNIKPYAAYSLTSDDWTVEPTADATSFPNDWFSKADVDTRMAQDIVSRYQDALNNISMARNDVMHLNARTALMLAVKQGAALFEDIHSGRKSAFTETGAGYSDYANFRWQHGKASGAIQAMKHLRDYHKATIKEAQLSAYGTELPDAATLVRRAAMQYRNQ